MQTAGPYLRYVNCLPHQKTWTGTVLFLTRDATSSPANGAPAAPNAAPHAGTPAAPSLSIEGADTEGKSSQAQLLDSVMGWHFWRFDIALELGPAQRPIRYSVTTAAGASKSATFWVPAFGQGWHWGYTSCNGISSDTAADAPARQDPTYLWRDLLAVHSAFPMHCLVGGGDQVYNDGVWKDCPGLKAWGDMDGLGDKLAAPWTPDLEADATAFYLNNYISVNTTEHVETAYASIPTVNVWDDHDIFDGWGSYDADLQACPVFQGLFGVARRFYLLFQQHTTPALAAKSDEWLDGAEGYHSVRYMGPKVALVCIDMRTRRTKKEILPQSTYQLLRSTLLELPQGIEHAVVLSGVPLVFPSIPFSEAILRNLKSLMTKVAFCRSIGKSAGLLDRFDQPEILDDLMDGWAAAVHTEEKLAFVRMLQEAALSRHFRVTILSGDAHVGGVGRLYGRPKKEPKDDPLFMPQIISSAIMNAPPPTGVVKMLMRTNFAKNLDERTRMKMVRAFWPYHPRSDKLIGLRNWCDVAPVEAPFVAPGNPNDPDLGGLRFALRVENPRHRKGYAEEVYDVVVPRAPQIGKAPDAAPPV